MGGRGIRSGWWRALRAAAVATLALGTVIVGLTAPSTAAPATWSPDSAHPYSDPVWFPLRTPATVSCAYSNCPGPFHGYWALDFVGALGDPVYAAGAGILHVGARDSSCTTSLSEPGFEGTWVWVDHGGGVVSRYHHLDSITVPDGSLVTPATQIGRMGHSGDIAPCKANYLHFEVRSGGLTGPRINPGQLLTCSNGAAASLPGLWGYSSWNSVTNGSRRTPTGDDSCLPGSARTPSAVATTTTQSGDQRATVRWSTPTDPGAGISGFVITRERWSPSVQRWSAEPSLRAAPTATSLTVPGLSNGRTYRFRVYADGHMGFSKAGPSSTVIPAAAPLAPRVARWLTSGSTFIRFAWWKAAHRGAPVIGYRVRIRQLTSAGWSPYRTTTIMGSSLSFRWTDLRPGRRFQVRVQALSSAGPSLWSPRRGVTTLRR
jgi:hypothetical protein